MAARLVLCQSCGQSSQIAARAESPHSLPSPPLIRLKGVGFLRACLLAALPNRAFLPPCERDARAPSTRDAGNAGVPPALPTAREKTYPFELDKGREGRGEGGFKADAFTNFGSAIGITDGRAHALPNGARATAASTTPTCWRCCSLSAAQARAAPATKTSTKTASSTTPTYWRCCSPSGRGVSRSARPVPRSLLQYEPNLYQPRGQSL